MLNDIFRMKRGVQSYRMSSYDKSGGNHDYIRIEAGSTTEIAFIEGPGIIRHIWFTLSSKDLLAKRHAIFECYWDDEETPSVESPLGEFFGQGWGEDYLVNSLPIIAAPMNGKAMNSYFSMPFRKNARLLIKNLSEFAIDSFYFYIDYERLPSIDDETLYFHAQWRRKHTPRHLLDGENEWGIFADPRPNKSNVNNYCFADIEGEGKFVGLQYYVDNPSPIWYGEGDDMWSIDGSEWPYQLHGTGTEDLFNTSWCPKEVFQHSYFGYPRVNESFGWLGRTHCYRYFIEDPIYFSRSLHASIEHGHNNALSYDLNTVAYWYQKEPHKEHKRTITIDMLKNFPAITVQDIHNWRHSFYMKHEGNLKVWGNEWRKD